MDYKSGKVRTGIKRDKNSQASYCAVLMALCSLFIIARMWCASTDQDPAGQSKAIAKAISEQNQISVRRIVPLNLRTEFRLASCGVHIYAPECQAAISKRLMDPAIIAVNFQFLVDLAVLLSFATVVGLLCEMMKLPVVFSQVPCVICAHRPFICASTFPTCM